MTTLTYHATMPKPSLSTSPSKRIRALQQSFPANPGRSNNIMKALSITLIVIAIVGLLITAASGTTNATVSVANQAAATSLLVFVASDEESENHVVRKNIEDLKFEQAASNGRLQVVAVDMAEQEAMVQRECPQGLAVFQNLVAHKQPHLAREMWKYCVLKQTNGPARLYVDASSPLLVRMMDLLDMAAGKNVAVLGEDYLPKTIHGSLLLVQPDKVGVAAQMLELFIGTPIQKLALDPLFLPRNLYDFITLNTQHSPLALGHNANWYLLEQFCHMDPLRRVHGDYQSWTGSDSYRLNHACSQATGFCCLVRNGIETTILLTRHPILPYQTISKNIPRPYNAEAGHFSQEELPYIATIQERVFTKPENYPPTPNFFDILLQNDCLPDGSTCSKCLREKSGANCKTCAAACPCYCKVLCREKTEKKFVAKELIVTPPLYARDPDRLIPRIIHQTYFEELSKTKYPNMSRLVESFKRSGWDYRFYSDEDAQNFLSTHFPAEVRQAYDALRPGAFKADLFRYCALLIHGGVYADVDIMLESSLDESIPKNVGFVVPVDEPGIEAKRPCCVWNGLIGSAPGHPIMAKAIETVVNQVRNRFTSVDTDNTYCPEPELSVLHAFDILYTAGPCLLGASINKVMGRPAQEPFVAGEIVSDKADAMGVPGRTIIWFQDKWDMGSHRFTFLEQNQVVAATDLENSNDRDNQPQTGKTEHYSKTHKAVGIYGLENLYKDKVRADEDISIVVARAGDSVVAVDK